MSLGLSLGSVDIKTKGQHKIMPILWKHPGAVKGINKQVAVFIYEKSS